ncbi:hypothetical protein HAX54_013846 [Datura stramonium]|uniref:Uncharacterized protein n=1 Tax=Datura stramonium TaxID=4076 RepID=A0ABS8TM03_DATST|nr:hypothetical protein [Datura stramonium]
MSSSNSLSFDHLPPPPPPPFEQLCYVHCNICNTVLAVSVPCTSLFKTATVRCGHCTNLLPGLLLPSANHHFSHAYFSPSHNLMEEITNAAPNFLMNNIQSNSTEFVMPARPGFDDLPRPPLINRPPEKRQRVPSAYNRFIKAKVLWYIILLLFFLFVLVTQWAHFPHIQFGIMPDQTVKRANVLQQDGEDGVMKDGLFSTSTNVSVSPY